MPTEPRGGENQIAPSKFPALHLPLPPPPSIPPPLPLLLPKDFSSALASIENTAPAAPELAWDSFVLLDSLTRLVLKVLGSGKSGRSGSDALSPQPGGQQGLCPLEEASLLQADAALGSESGGTSAPFWRPWLDSMQSGHAAAVAIASTCSCVPMSSLLGTAAATSRITALFYGRSSLAANCL